MSMTVTPPIEPETSPPPAQRRRHHPFRLAGAGLAVVVLAALAISVGRYVFRSHPAPKSVDAAVEDLRAQGTTPETGAVSFARPAMGVYTATGEGRESLTPPPNSQDDGATMPITVRYLTDGCWNWHIDYNVAHWHEYDFCPQGTELLLVGQRNYQAWDYGAMKVSNVGEYTCEPPAPIVVEDPKPGQVFQHSCSGGNSAAPGPSLTQGPSTVLGPEVVNIGGTDVPAIRQHRVQQMTGTQNGVVTEEWWFAADTGLPLRCDRTYDIKSGSVIGDITYHEEGSWQLASLEPRT